MQRNVLKKFSKIVSDMEKYLWIQAISTEESSRIYKDGKLYESGTKEYGKIFAEFDTLRRNTKVLFQNECLTLCNREDSFFIAGNFNELDSAMRRMAYNFYIQGVEKNQLIKEFKSSLEGYTISVADEEVLREKIKRHRSFFIKPKRITMLLIVLIVVFFFIVIFLNNKH